MSGEYVVSFFGYSGSKAHIDFDTGQDPDRLFQLAAGSLLRMSKHRRPMLMVLGPVKAWTYKAIFNTVEQLHMANLLHGARIAEMHVCCHGGTSMLSLANHFDNGIRLEKRAVNSHYNAVGTDKDAQPYIDLDREDALMSGTLSVFKEGLDDDRKVRTEFLRNLFAPNAYIHLWGCYSGAEFADFSLTAGRNTRWPPVVKEYMLRIGELRKPNPGVGRDMAMTLGVPVTAARLLPKQTSGGVEFYYRDENGRFLKTKNNVAYKPPIVMWPIQQSQWVTYGPDGKQRKTLRFFDQEVDPKKGAGGDAPKWFTDIYR